MVSETYLSSRAKATSLRFNNTRHSQSDAEVLESLVRRCGERVEELDRFRVRERLGVLEHRSMTVPGEPKRRRVLYHSSPEKSNASRRYDPTEHHQPEHQHDAGSPQGLPNRGRHVPMSGATCGHYCVFPVLSHGTDVANYSKCAKRAPSCRLFEILKKGKRNRRNQERKRNRRNETSLTSIQP
jgi:hypothetical protein